MNDEVKEILIDLVDYYNVMGTENDPGIGVFEDVAIRASAALKRYASEVSGENNNLNSADVDPFAITGEHPMYKSEDEW